MMNWTTLAIALAVLALLVILHDVLEPYLKKKPRTLMRETVLVQVSDGSAIQGLLWEELPKFLVLRNATHREVDQAVQVDGEAWIPRERVVWIQAVQNWRVVDAE